ncbi:hypothetical protein TYRP_007114 [Tyrophagus putrescentiae]|nr:hypothetical protein TYRP_007114 [Tyrophagus putrescentiae]
MVNEKARSYLIESSKYYKEICLTDDSIFDGRPEEKQNINKSFENPTNHPYLIEHLLVAQLRVLHSIRQPPQMIEADLQQSQQEDDHLRPPFNRTQIAQLSQQVLLQRLLVPIASAQLN